MPTFADVLSASTSLRTRRITGATALAVLLGAAVAGAAVPGGRGPARAEAAAVVTSAATTPPAAPDLGPGVGPHDFGVPLALVAAVGEGGVGVPSGTTTPATTAAVVSALSASGIPLVALDAYQRAATIQATENPGCHITWPLVAGIGRVESNHGRFGGAQLHTDGTDLPRIIGIALDGTRSARIMDTDHGVLDGDTVYDRAVGPMQFIPSTWAHVGIDANGDGRADPFNIYDAAATTGRYLCRAGGDLSTDAGRTKAVRAYNDVDSYVSTVLALAVVYAGGYSLDPRSAAPPVAASSAAPSVPPSSGPPSSSGPTSPTSTPPTSPPPTSPGPSCTPTSPPTSTGTATSTDPASSGSPSSGSPASTDPASSGSPSGDPTTTAPTCPTSS